MSVEESIKNMLAEIRLYGGNFGDPIVEHIDFSPLEVLRTLNAKVSLGAGIALLVEFSNHIDNATYSDALKGVAAKNISSAIAGSLCQEHPLIVRALIAALESEDAFKTALIPVYAELVANT